MATGQMGRYPEDPEAQLSPEELRLRSHRTRCIRRTDVANPPESSGFAVRSPAGRSRRSRVPIAAATAPSRGPLRLDCANAAEIVRYPSHGTVARSCRAPPDELS